MNFYDVATVLANRRIWLYVENGILRFTAPKGVMDQDTRTKIGKYRELLLSIVQNNIPFPCLLAPATSNQASLLFIQKLAPYTCAYNVAASFRFCNPLVKPPFEAACRKLHQRHPQLRTSITTIFDNEISEQSVYQIVRDGIPPEISYYYEEYNTTADLRKAVIADYQRPFDFEMNSSLARWSVFDAAGTSPVIMLTMHHSIVDAWSMNILMKEFFTEYSRRIVHPEYMGSEEFQPSFGYIDFALQQQKLLSEEYFEEHLRFFKTGLQDYLRPLDLPTDSPHPEIANLRGESIPFVIPPEQFQKITLFTKQNGVTLNTVLLTAFMHFIHTVTGRQHFTTGMPVSNRTNPSLLDTVGYFVNTIAIPCTVKTDSTFSELMKEVYETTARSIEFQELPFASVVNLLNPPRDPSRSPVFQILFNFLSRTVAGAAADFMYESRPIENQKVIEGVSVTPFPIPQQEGQYDITLEIIERDGFATGQLKYSTSLFTNKTAHRLLEQYLRSLEQLLTNPSRRISVKKESVVPAKTKLVIAATFTADLLSEGLNFWSDRLNLDITPQFAPYGQVMQQLLDPESQFSTNVSGCNVLLIRLDDLMHTNGNNEPFSEIVSQRCEEIYTAVVATASIKALLLVFFCPSSPELIKDPIAKATIDNIQCKYMRLFNELPGVYATTSDTILTWYPIEQYHDKVRLENGHIPYSDIFFTALATAIVRRFFVIQQKPVKVIAIDCDNTLWSGVSAEDGPDGVIVSPHHQQFQRLLTLQLETGKLLTLVSKNRVEDVHSVFTQNKTMHLSESAIYSSRINWLPKSENVRSLSEEINVSLEGFLFIDDNPVECAELSSTMPQVLTVQFPSYTAEIPEFINGLWMLDCPKTTREDRQRSEFYRIEQQRNAIREQCTLFVDFLKNLELVVEFAPFDEHNGERLSQLTYRTNQFNFTGKNYSYQDLRLLQSSGYDIQAISVKDRFGAYGIVGMTACRFGNDVAHVEMLLLSCRVLGRGVEYHIVNKLIETAGLKKVSLLKFHYTITDRNRPAMDFIVNLLLQHPSGQREDSFVSITLTPPPYFSVTTATSIHSSGGVPSRAEPGEINTIQPLQDITKRNRCYYDISKHLSTLDRICDAVDKYLHSGQKISIVPVVPIPGVLPFETSISEIWGRTLRTAVSSTTTNFFDLGGKSLQLPQILSDLERAFGINLQLVDLFKYTTIKALATYIHERVSNNGIGQKNILPATTNRRQTGMQMMRLQQQQSRSKLNS